jgi:small subunit ribosomal protein S5
MDTSTQTPIVETTAPDTATEVTVNSTQEETSTRPAVPRQKNFRKNSRKPGLKRERVKPEFDHKIINIRRVTRVVAGGRRFSFSVALIAGNRKGSVGVGTGKAGDTALAIEKAMRSAKKNMVALKLTKTFSIPYDISAKYCAGRVFIAPAPGHGVTAGSSVRNVIELAGIKDVRAKILSGSKNKLNNAWAAVRALSEFKV